MHRNMHFNREEKEMTSRLSVTGIAVFAFLVVAILFAKSSGEFIWLFPR